MRQDQPRSAILDSQLVACTRKRWIQRAECRSRLENPEHGSYEICGPRKHQGDSITWNCAVGNEEMRDLIRTTVQFGVARDFITNENCRCAGSGESVIFKQLMKAQVSRVFSSRLVEGDDDVVALL